MTHALNIKDLYFRYPQKERDLLKGINLDVKIGEMITIMGLSGNGKSTLCYCMAGLFPNIFPGELKGEISIFGKPISKMKKAEIVENIGIVFQNPDNQLFSPMVEDEVAFGPENLCLNRKEIENRVTESLKLVGMEAYRYSNPNHLSGGQKQLVALAAVLSLKPKILILDEAMAQVDKVGKETLKKVLLDLKSQNKTIIMVEHDLNNIDIADRVLVLKEGRLENVNRERLCREGLI